MGLLRLNVLGPPEVFHDGNRLTFALRKAQALLLYLAVEGGMHQRRKLDAFLWPDSEPHEARAALRNATWWGAFSRHDRDSRGRCWWWARQALAKRGWPTSLWPGVERRGQRRCAGMPLRWGDGCPTSHWWRPCESAWRRRTRRRIYWRTCGWLNSRACCRNCGCAIPTCQLPPRMS